MGFFGLFGNTYAETRTLPGINTQVQAVSAQAFTALFGDVSRSFTGETVNEQTALGVPAVWSAVNFLAATVAALPLQLFKKADEGRVLASSNPLYRILHDQVNDDYLTSFGWRKWMMERLLLNGRAFTFIERNGMGQVKNLWPLDPRSVTVESDGMRKQYRWRRSDGKEFIYQPSEIIDVMWMSGSDGTSHIDPINNNRNSLGLAIAAERYASIMFENGGVPPLVMTGPSMSPEAAARASTQMAERMKRDRDMKRNVFVLDGGYDLKPIGLDGDKLQVLELRKFQITEVARIFGLPPVFLQDLSTGTYSNTEQQDLNFVKHTLTQWLERIEQEINCKLFGDRNRQNMFCEFNVDGLLRGDLASRMAAYATSITNAIRTPNEVRALENLPDLPGGDRLYIQGATVPLETQGDDPSHDALPEPNPVTHPDESDVADDDDSTSDPQTGSSGANDQ